MKLAISSSVAVSLGSRGLKRMIRSGSRREPAIRTRPRTSSALTRIEPRIAVWATIFSPALSAKMTTKNSGRLPSVDCIRPVTAGPKRWPTCSVENDTIHAPPASARPATTNAATCGTLLTYRAMPARTVRRDAGQAHALAPCQPGEDRLPAGHHRVVIVVGRCAAAQ